MKVNTLFLCCYLILEPVYTLSINADRRRGSRFRSIDFQHNKNTFSIDKYKHYLRDDNKSEPDSNPEITEQSTVKPNGDVKAAGVDDIPNYNKLPFEEANGPEEVNGPEEENGPEEANGPEGFRQDQAGNPENHNTNDTPTNEEDVTAIESTPVEAGTTPGNTEADVSEETTTTGHETALEETVTESAEENETNDGVAEGTGGLANSAATQSTNLDDTQATVKYYNDKQIPIGPGNGLKRTLVAGDYFTAKELLPVTQKFIGKVENPGSGAGVVSSSKNADVLAEVLFNRFFLTKKQIVTLEAVDIAGLDALQALSLGGLKAGDQDDDAISKLSKEGETIYHDNGIRSCRYKVLYKNGPVSEEPITKLPQARTPRIGRNRVTAPYEEGYEKKTSHSGDGAATQQPTKYSDRHATCLWIYACEFPANLETCGVKKKCEQFLNKTLVDYKVEPVEVNKDEHTEDVKALRRMLGLSIVDEEVEKILQAQYIAYAKEKKKRDLQKFVDRKVEVGDFNAYLDNLMQSQKDYGTTPVPVEKTEEKIEHPEQEKPAIDNVDKNSVPPIDNVDNNSATNDQSGQSEKEIATVATSNEKVVVQKELIGTDVHLPLPHDEVAKKTLREIYQNMRRFHQNKKVWLP